MSEELCRRSECAGAHFVNLGVRRHGRVILVNVNAVAPCGGATVIVGPNGAGKTTLLRCLLGETAFTGKIEFVGADGRVRTKPRLGYVPQQLLADAQMPLRVYEFLAIGRGWRPLWLGCSRKARRQARESLALVNAEMLETSRLGELSGGELRRVLLAAALSRRPDLLVLDEAEAGVDYRGERLFWELLDNTRKEFGFTLLMVSHNLPLAAHYATHVICIKKTVLAQGSPATTLTGENLLALFGIPIHLYPRECGVAGPACPQCGAFGSLPYAASQKGNQASAGQKSGKMQML